jgi:hypothetical protein
VGPFSLGNRTFDDNMVDLVIIVSALPLGIKVSITAPSDCKYCAVRWKSFGLLLGFLDLWRTWWRWVGFGFYLGIGVILR